MSLPYRIAGAHACQQAHAKWSEHDNSIAGPGQTLLFPHDEACPYVVVKTGPVNEDGEYDYLILSQFLKSPVLGLARAPLRFATQHKVHRLNH